MPVHGGKFGGSRDLSAHPEGDTFSGLKGKGGRFFTVSRGMRNLCVLVVTLVLAMGVLSMSYIETSYETLVSRNSAWSRRPKSFPVFQNTIDAATSDRLLRISQEDVAFEAKAGATAPEHAVEHMREVARDTQLTVEGEKSDGSPREQKKSSSIVENLRSTTDSEDATAARAPVEPEKTTRGNSNEEQGPNIELLLGSESDTDVVTSEETQIDSSSLDPAPNSTAASGRCDIAVGHWVHDPTGPLYRFNNCRILSQAQNCQANGRPDSGYESYKWQPEGCSIPRFDGHAFLELMRGKTLAFVGDSLARNQMESLMCILFQVADARSRGSRSMHRWYFPSHEFTIVRLWSSWLVRSSGDFPESLAPPEAIRLNLTDLDENFAYHLPKFDVTVISTGHWWLRKTAYFMGGEMLGGMGWTWLPEHGEKKLDHIKAFGVAVDTALRFLGSRKGYKGLTILRTYTPDHYSGGTWDTGGSCLGETRPYEKSPENSYNQMMYQKQLGAFQANQRKGNVMPNGSRLRMLDVFPILNYRGDGHPGPYRSSDPLKRTTRDEKGRPPPQDCLHWCLPGPFDSMNELLFQILKEEMQ